MTAFLQNILWLPRALRAAGVTVSLEQTVNFTEALELIEIGERDQVFHAARSMLINRKEHLVLFETLFNRFWQLHLINTAKGQAMPIAPRHNVKKRKQFNVVTYMAYKAQQQDEEIEVIDKSGTFSNAEVLQRKEFSQMAPEELETIKQLMQKMRWEVSLRETRRWVPDAQGNKIYLRRMLREATKLGGVPLKLAHQSRKIKQRPLILLADISGSMEKYARLMLQFFYSVSHSLKHTECFVFGTRLTRITPSLKLKNIDRAIDDAAREVVDWSGGTRIGESLHLFNMHWSKRVVRRGALVLVVSDGWERGDVSLLENEMRYLQRRCHRLIWLNPLLGRSTYRPLVEGMSAAMPYIDDFLPIHNLQSLTALAEHLASLGQHQRPKSAIFTKSDT